MIQELLYFQGSENTLNVPKNLLTFVVRLKRVARNVIKCISVTRSQFVKKNSSAIDNCLNSELGDYATPQCSQLCFSNAIAIFQEKTLAL